MTEYRRADQFVYRHIAGEHLLVAIHHDRVAPLFTFTPSAAALWHELADWRSANALAEYLVGRYDVTPEAAARDVAEFLEQLGSMNALTTRDRTP
jgi:hypothetical protein